MDALLLSRQGKYEIELVDSAQPIVKNVWVHISCGCLALRPRESDGISNDRGTHVEEQVSI